MIKWVGYSEEENTWEPAHNLTADLITDFEKRSNECKATQKKEMTSSEPKQSNHKRAKTDSLTHDLANKEKTVEPQRRKCRVEEKSKEHTYSKPLKKNQLMNVKPIPAVGDLCFGKVKGFVAWPCVITAVELPTIWVKFFNSTLR